MSKAIADFVGLKHDIQYAPRLHDANGNPVFGVGYMTLRKIETAIDALAPVASGEKVTIPSKPDRHVKRYNKWPLIAEFEYWVPEEDWAEWKRAMIQAKEE